MTKRMYRIVVSDQFKNVMADSAGHAEELYKAWLLSEILTHRQNKTEFPLDLMLWEEANDEVIADI